MRKVLLCTPYENKPNVNWGGISVWANNIISFAKARVGIDEVLIIPVSYDRYHNISSKMNTLLRVWYGFVDIRKSIKQTKILLRQNDIDVIHVCSSASLSLIKDIYLLFLAKIHRIKYVIHFHFGLIPELQKKNSLEWRLLKYVVKYADNTIVMTRDSLMILKSLNIGNVVFLPNPISDSFSVLLSQMAQKTERVPRRIVYVGHIVPNKGIKEIIVSCKAIRDLDVRLVGEIPSVEYFNSLKALMDHSATGTSFSFLGKVSQEDVVKEMLSSELFVFPSYYEGFPNVILEAMACECPIIASSVGAIPEMLDINSSPCGVCIPCQDSDALRTAIESLLNDSSLRRDIASKAKHRVEAEYSTAHLWTKLVKIWDA